MNMRAGLIEELFKEIHGPRNGCEETLEIHEDPLGEYITGVIIPRSCRTQQRNPESETGALLGGNSAADNVSDEFQASDVPELDPQIRPRSFGLSFVINDQRKELKICVTWARYRQVSDQGRTYWKRTPHRSIQSIRVDGEKPRRIRLKELNDSGDSGLELYIRRVPKQHEESSFLVTVINQIPLAPKACYKKALTEASIFQPSIRVLVADGRETESSSVYAPPARDTLEFLYRARNVRARGHMCSAIWSEIDYADHIDRTVLWPDGEYFPDCVEFQTPDFRTEFVPLVQTASPDFEWPSMDAGRKPELSAEALSELWAPEDIEKALNPFKDAYEEWIQQNEGLITDFRNQESTIAAEILNSQKETLIRLKLGIDLLKSNKEARIAFCFANRVISLQHDWKKNPEDDSFSWKPFQLGFFLLCIEPLCHKTSRYREIADLLWIPTGGGKTEAYLAIMAFTVAFRRIESHRTNGALSGLGTSVITRYTLRLLTIQQFRRTLSMITAAEYLRVFRSEQGFGWRPKDCTVTGDWIYGTQRFSVGLWVGAGVTPNHLRGGDDNAIHALSSPKRSSEPAQITNCPVCKTWLSVPTFGLPAGRHLFHVIVRVDGNTTKSFETRQIKIASINSAIERVTFSDHNLPQGYATVTLCLNSHAELGEQTIDDIIESLGKSFSFAPASFRGSRPGYFGQSQKLGDKAASDFEVYCPNPECELNNDVTYIEGVLANPEEQSTNQLPDGLVERRMKPPFSLGKRIPIPGFTVDEQIYYKCPTVLVSTADKIARLAFEPRSATIFGNVDCFSPYYGYHRTGLLPKDAKAALKKTSVYVSPFLPPDLIVQDELHLVEGPLGSMYGIYEAVIEALVKSSAKRLGSTAIPKYIASTATIRHADSQIRSLFARKLNQFPPHGLNIDDNFFSKVRKQASGWDEKIPSRIYFGVCTPGISVQTALSRLWARLLKARTDCRHSYDARYFWTLVGYFNSIRELAGARALYREDVAERLGTIGGRANLDPQRVYDLSSLAESTNLPSILSDLEACEHKEIESHPDAVFTTSMFGTGVDIRHLSLMLVDGQPKTTSQYIQATGRVGRKHGALVVSFYRAGRARDLNHYEMFSAYHHRMYLQVEPSSVSPFSDGVLARALGPAVVSFLRNKSDPAIDWYKEDGSVILQKFSEKDLKEFKDQLVERVSFVTGKSHEKQDHVLTEIEHRKDRWENIARSLARQDLVFWEYVFKKVQKNVVLGDPAHDSAKKMVVFKNSPTSLREVEETTAFEV